MKKKNKVLYGLLAGVVVFILCAAMWVLTSRSAAYTYSQRSFIENYQFYEDGQAISVKWKEDEAADDDLNPLASNTLYWTKNVSFSDKYIVNQSFKIKGDPTDYDGTGRDNEWWYLDVYAIHDGEIYMTTFDLFDAATKYKDNYVPVKVKKTVDIRYKKQDYATLTVKMQGSKELEDVMMNLETGQIVALPDDYKKYVIKRTETNLIYDLNLDQALTDQGIVASANTFKINSLVQDTSSWRFASYYPDAYSWFNESHEDFYILKQGLSAENMLNLVQLFFPEDQDIYEGLTIPASLSKDKKAHTVKSYDEFYKYYKAAK